MLEYVIPIVVGAVLGNIAALVIFNYWFVGSKAEAALDAWLTRRGWL